MIGDLWLRLVMRPLGRLLGTKRWEPHAASRVACLSCQYSCVYVFPVAFAGYQAETGHVFKLECPACGSPSMSSI